MSGETDWRGELQVNPLVSKLTQLTREQSTQSRAFWGYVGQSEEEGSITLHTSLENLGETIEIPVTDILHIEDVPESILLFGAKVVWVRRDAHVTRRQGARAGTLTKMTPVPGTQARSERPGMGPQGGGVVEREEGRLRMQMKAREFEEASCSSPCSTCVSPCSTCRSECSVCISICEYR